MLHNHHQQHFHLQLMQDRSPLPEIAELSDLSRRKVPSCLQDNKTSGAERCRKSPRSLLSSEPSAAGNHRGPCVLRAERCRKSPRSLRPQSRALAEIPERIRKRVPCGCGFAWEESWRFGKESRSVCAPRRLQPRKVFLGFFGGNLRVLMSRSEDGSFVQDPLTSSPGGPCDDPELLATTEAFARGFDCVSISSFSGERLIQGQEDTASIISTATLVPECIYIPPAGFQLLSEQEWAQQKAALQSATERLEVVTQEKEALQDALRCSSEDCANQASHCIDVKQLLEQIKSSEEILQGLQRTMADTQQKTSQKMAALTASFSRMCQEVNGLDDESEKLRTLSLQAPPAGQNAQLSTPQRAAQHRQERLCIEIVSLQEELKGEQVAKQEVEEQLRRTTDTHTEERGVNELSLGGGRPSIPAGSPLRSTWTVDVAMMPRSAPPVTDGRPSSPSRPSLLVSDLAATLSSLRTEMERIQQDRKQAELQLQESEGQVQKLWESLGDQEKVLQQEKVAAPRSVSPRPLAQSPRPLAQSPRGPSLSLPAAPRSVSPAALLLLRVVSSCLCPQTSLDLALADERSKVSRLQTELRTSEEVQRDFVRLSQKLQVSLEKIRQATSMEDVHDILEGTRFTDVSQLSDT
ncbi:unnamed protein product [Ranitomeya imitator]|uniref:Rab GTPase-binding effector protein 2 n=1 Tax=Ranitomeya imitator TaxID=111125 RepID=A0ABN9LBG9_9NEOB|nr:unnamed protein product [Ranitomeya imitator]